MKTGLWNPVIYCHRNFWKIVDLLYPPVCGGCEKQGIRWCEDCEKQVKILAEPLCPVCGLPVGRKGDCRDCSPGLQKDFTLRSWAAFDGPLRNAIHRIKYKQDIGLAENFVQYMVEGIEHQGWIFDMVIPVPLNKTRLKERGYNQSALLAWPIASFFRANYSTNALQRTRNTITQTSLDAESRRNNVNGAFFANPEIVQGKRLLLIDDLATTCATIEACTIALNNAGARSVFAFTLARTL
jgi:competence protein ComFC